MTDESSSKPRFDPDKVALKVGRALTGIETLYVDLHWQAYAKPNDRDFPGGVALNMLGPSANPAEWERLYEEAQASVWNSDDPMDKFDDYANDQVDGHPLFVLAAAVTAVRDARNEPTGLTPTLSRSTDYLRKHIPWMVSVTENGEPIFPQVIGIARDMVKARTAMENVLLVGVRHDSSAAACFNDPEHTGTVCGGELVRRTLKRTACTHEQLREQVATWAARPDVKDEKQHPYVTLEFLRSQFPAAFKDHTRANCDLGGRDDVYKCNKCNRRYDEAGYWLAVKEHHERLAG